MGTSTILYLIWSFCHSIHFLWWCRSTDAEEKFENGPRGRYKFMYFAVENRGGDGGNVDAVFVIFHAVWDLGANNSSSSMGNEEKEEEEEEEEALARELHSRASLSAGVDFDLLPSGERERLLATAREFRRVNDRGHRVSLAEKDEWTRYFRRLAVQSFANCQRQLVARAEEAVRAAAGAAAGATAGATPGATPGEAGGRGGRLKKKTLKIRLFSACSSS